MVSNYKSKPIKSSLTYKKEKIEKETLGSVLVLVFKNCS